MCHFKSFKTYGLVLIVCIMSSCEKTLLNPIPQSILTTANTYNTAKSINLAVLGIYNALQTRIQTDYMLMEMPSDNMWVGYASTPGLEEIGTLSETPDDPILESYWQANYRGIFLANTVLANINNPTDYSTGQKDQYTGEAEFLRAKFYFDLVRIFGGVPEDTTILTAEESTTVGRASEQDIYNLIVRDLTDAVSKLPDPSETTWGRASKGAAIALLAKVYVYLQDWQDAKTYLDELFSDFNYSLVPHYADLFNIATEQNSEAIFSVPFVAGTNGQTLTYDLAPIGGIYDTVSNGNRIGRPTWDLRSAFDSGDTRFAVTMRDEVLPANYQPGDSAVFYPYFNKWITPSDPDESGLDIPILRLGDMVLLDAEVLYNLNMPQAALDQINKIRQRAFLDTLHDYTLSDISTKDEFYDKLLLERRLELACENNRWFDLVRTGRFVTVLQNIKGDYSSITGGGGAVTIPVQAQDYMKYFPIPQEEIDLAAKGVLQQNPGY
jgi:starch-binding outer membrane protein, SusD/RagB family